MLLIFLLTVLGRIVRWATITTCLPLMNKSVKRVRIKVSVMETEIFCIEYMYTVPHAAGARQVISPEFLLEFSDKS